RLRRSRPRTWRSSNRRGRCRGRSSPVQPRAHPLRSAPQPGAKQARQALDFMLRQQEPYPAIVVDRNWTILKANGGAVRLVEAFADPSAASEWGGNAMRLMFHPRGFRPHIVNWAM